MSTAQTQQTFEFNDLKLFRRGKVRDVFDFDDHLLIVSSDRVSAFDHIINNGIPGKGQVLTKISQFWFNYLNVPHHCVSTNVDDFPEITHKYRDQIEGRSMWVKKTELIPIECVVRGYIIGSGWKDYKETGSVCGHKLPEGLKLAQKLEAPLFTPAYKAMDGGHDENISIEKMTEIIGESLTNQLQTLSLDIYNRASAVALEKGIIIADTKFEFGLLNGEVIIIDEVLTPDSSRFWPKDKYQEGISPPSFDKQIVRDYIESTSWDKQAPIPQLPEEIINKTSQEYQAIADLLIND
jgi:phosphoribosylaminoimidazole-succinocarboxamide synthase